MENDKKCVFLIFDSKTRLTKYLREPVSKTFYQQIRKMFDELNEVPEVKVDGKVDDKNPAKSVSSVIGSSSGTLGIRWTRLVLSALHLSLFSGHLWSKIHIQE